jgi:hypothetical protein
MNTSRIEVVDRIRNVLYPVLLLQCHPHIIGKLARHLERVDAAHIRLQALPLGDPRLGRVSEREEALKHLRRAALNRIWVVRQMEELLTVGAALITESLPRSESSAKKLLKRERILSLFDEEC